MSLLQIDEKKWRPYESSANELSTTSWICSGFYKFRWFVLKPFHYKLPFIKLTLGFVLVFLGAIAAVAAIQYVTTEKVNPQNKSLVGPQNPEPSHFRSKTTASLPSVIIGIVFAFTSYNSVFTFLFRIPFESLLYWHKLIAVLGLASSIVHGVYGFLDKAACGRCPLSRSHLDTDSHRIHAFLPAILLLLVFIYPLDIIHTHDNIRNISRRLRRRNYCRCLLGHRSCYKNNFNLHIQEVHKKCEIKAATR